MRFYAVKNAVDEAMRVFRRKNFRKVDGFVNRNNRRNVVSIKQFVNREAQNREVATRKSGEAPIFRARAERFVDVVKMVERSRDKFFRECVIFARF